MSKSGVYELAVQYHDQTAALRRWFHAFPESSFQEYETSRKIKEELDRLGIPYESAGETGIVAAITGGKLPGKTVGLRADIDALEIEEKNRVPYRSRRKGRMHACGHDGHAASLLTAARILNGQKDGLRGTVKLIFQPAEEIGRGAEQIVKTGLLDDVDAFFGIHVTPELQTGQVSVVKGPIMAGANSLKVVLKGKSGHAAQPNEAIDAVVAGSAVVQALQQIVSREADPVEPAVVTIGEFHAGTRGNIIANRAELTGTLRVITEASRKTLSQAVRRVVRSTAAAYRVGVQVECDYATPIVINSESLYDPVLRAATSFLPREAVVQLPIVMGTDDFAVYSTVAPAFYARVGVRSPSGGVGSTGSYPMHHERFDLDEHALDVVAAFYAAFALQFLHG